MADDPEPSNRLRIAFSSSRKSVFAIFPPISKVSLLAVILLSSQPVIVTDVNELLLRSDIAPVLCAVLHALDNGHGDRDKTCKKWRDLLHLLHAFGPE